ncbi:hypothetical protein [Shewanella marisflavi]|uniref:Uncharacterized protein n=1 Tax=Shewanella marisflavi TaxID=260364 RepID=A0ABX5WUV9_9GAMM|nr:hypothetical protein [Shewanella marisflavi]QDF76299.1 hypothetical protein FGA12_14690 [Shewanella marisflavi]
MRPSTQYTNDDSARRYNSKSANKAPAGQALDGDEGTTFNYLSSIPTGHKTHSVSLVYLHNPVGQATDCHRRYGVYHLCRITN